MLFSDVILGWYYHILGRKFVMIIGKQTSYWSKTGLCLSLPVKKVNNNKFSSQNIVISSQNNVSKNNVQDDMNKSKMIKRTYQWTEHEMSKMHHCDFYTIWRPSHHIHNARPFSGHISFSSSLKSVSDTTPCCSRGVDCFLKPGGWGTQGLIETLGSMVIFWWKPGCFWFE